VQLKVRGKRSADIPVRQRQSGEQNADPTPQDRNVLPPQKRQNAALTIEQPGTFNCTHFENINQFLPSIIGGTLFDPIAPRLQERMKGSCPLGERAATFGLVKE